MTTLEEGETVDSDEIKGKAKDIKGRVERQAGEWTGSKDAQAQGMKDQVSGKVQNAWGKVKDAGFDVKGNIDRNLQRDKLDRDPDRDIETDVEQDRDINKDRNAA